MTTDLRERLAEAVPPWVGLPTDRLHLAAALLPVVHEVIAEELEAAAEEEWVPGAARRLRLRAAAIREQP